MHALASKTINIMLQVIKAVSKASSIFFGEKEILKISLDQCHVGLSFKLENEFLPEILINSPKTRGLLDVPYCPDPCHT